MINPDKRVLQALVSLRGDARFESVLGWLRDCRDDEAKSSAIAESDLSVRRAQGAFGALGFVLEAYQTAPDVLERSTKRREHP